MREHGIHRGTARWDLLPSNLWAVSKMLHQKMRPGHMQQIETECHRLCSLHMHRVEAVQSSCWCVASTVMPAIGSRPLVEGGSTGTLVADQPAASRSEHCTESKWCVGLQGIECKFIEQWHQKLVSTTGPLFQPQTVTALHAVCLMWKTGPLPCLPPLVC